MKDINKIISKLSTVLTQSDLTNKQRALLDKHVDNIETDLILTEFEAKHYGTYISIEKEFTESLSVDLRFCQYISKKYNISVNISTAFYSKYRK